MKKLTALVPALLLVANASFAAVKTYQVTGNVKSVTADMIVVEKGKEVWELARDGATKVNGDLKAGSKVTIEYRMTATKVDVKTEKAPAPKKK